MSNLFEMKHFGGLESGLGGGLRTASEQAKIQAGENAQQNKAMQEMLEEYKKAVEAQKVQSTNNSIGTHYSGKLFYSDSCCPSCGYCRHCGRGGRYSYPNYWYGSPYNRDYKGDYKVTL